VCHEGQSYWFHAKITPTPFQLDGSDSRYGSSVLGMRDNNRPLVSRKFPLLARGPEGGRQIGPTRQAVWAFQQVRMFLIARPTPYGAGPKACTQQWKPSGWRRHPTGEKKAQRAAVFRGSRDGWLPSYTSGTPVRHLDHAAEDEEPIAGKYAMVRARGDTEYVIRNDTPGSRFAIRIRKSIRDQR
jgi:hypothetical protein